MRSAAERERSLRKEMKMRLAQDASEKEQLIAEIKRTHESMDELSGKHRHLIEDVAARNDHVAELEVCLYDLSHHL